MHEPPTKPVLPGVWCGAWLAAVLAGAALVAWPGCSVDKHYKVLSFFFDGVPDPNAPRGVAGVRGGLPDMRASPTYTIHKPFADETCAECHRSALSLERVDVGVCLRCHEPLLERYPHMHGPVVAMACLWCHDPHESAYTRLMKGEARAVCTQCHEPGLLDSRRVPAHADAARGCLDCHTGHGGAEPFFLLEGVARTPPPEPGADRGTPPGPGEGS